MIEDKKFWILLGIYVVFMLIITFKPNKELRVVHVWLGPDGKPAADPPLMKRLEDERP